MRKANVPHGRPPGSAAAPARLRLRSLGALALLLAGAGVQARDDRISVRALKRDSLVVVDVTLLTETPLAVAWATLTDYEHMTGFISGLKTSTVLRRQGARLEVSQAGEKQIGPLHVSFASVRAVDLLPMHEIRTQLISGDFKHYASSTRLREEGGDTVVEYHGEYEPTAWVPPLLGTGLIEDETRRHYTEMAQEARRRAALPGAPRRGASAP